MFGDGQWIEERTAAQYARLEAWLDEIKAAHCRLGIVEIGAGMAIPSVRHMSEAVARRTGATLIRINPRDHQVPDGHLGIPLGALAGIQAVTSGERSSPANPYQRAGNDRGQSARAD